LAGLPDHAEGPRTERNGPTRSGSVQRAKPDCERARCFGATTVWRTLPSNHGVRGSAEVAGASAEPDGCGAADQREQSDSAGGRRENWAVRLQLVFEQPGADAKFDQLHAAENSSAIV